MFGTTCGSYAFTQSLQHEFRVVLPSTLVYSSGLSPGNVILLRCDHDSITAFPPLVSLGREVGPNKVKLWLFGEPFEEAVVHFQTCYLSLPAEERIQHFRPYTSDKKEHPHVIRIRGPRERGSPL